MSKHQIEVSIRLDCDDEEKRAISRITEAIEAAARIEKIPLIEVSVLLASDEFIRKLNREYRGLDRSTDVLSFPLWEDKVEWDDSKVTPIGDLVISLPKAKEQANEYGHSLEREVAFLAVHGFLHLIGYIHDSVESEKRMFQRQEKILSEIGLMR